MNLNSQAANDSAASDSIKTTVSDTGVIKNNPLEEKVSDEDVSRIERLNDETMLEYGEIGDLDIAGAEDDFDSLFDSEEDSSEAITTVTTETVKVDPKDKPISFSGSLSAELGGYVWFQPLEKTKPLAAFSNTLKFVGRPMDDFYVVGSLKTVFPEMSIGVYELYFDYTLFGRVDVSAGKRDLSWSVSRMLDTNILDDESTVKTNDEEVFNPRERTADDSKFFATLNIPIFSYASIQGVAYYFPYTDDISGDNIAVAGKIEGSIGKVSLSVLGMRWANNDDYALNPVLGAEIVSTILGKDSNMFVQGLMHVSPDSEKKFNRARVSTGIYKYFPNPIMLGLAFEYQGIWSEDDTVFGTGKEWQHYFAAQIAWSHFIFSKKWTFGVEWFHDMGNEYGTVLPVIKIEDILKYTDFRIALPVRYGSDKRYGLIFEVILNLDY